MENIVAIILLILAIVLLKFIFKISIKNAKKLEENKELQKITNRFPSNKEIAEEILNNLGNKNVKIEEAKDTNTSLYIAITNKIIIADMKESYGRIQTIAHECAHSIQDKRILMFNFIFSNIYILYYLVILGLTMFNIISNTMLHLFILTVLSMVKLIVRTYLEAEAMTKSRYIAEKYIQDKNLCTKEEKQELLTEYDKINKMGIPFMIHSLLTSQLLLIIVYAIIGII